MLMLAAGIIPRVSLAHVIDATREQSNGKMKPSHNGQLTGDEGMMAIGGEDIKTRANTHCIGRSDTRHSR